MKIISFFKLIKYALHKKITPPIEYAKELGANIGFDCFIPDIDCLSSEPYLITIGNHCQITSGVRLFTHGGGQVLRDKYPGFDTFGKITIGNWVYIGNNSLIMPGVTIGDNVLVAAGSVVTKSVPSRVVVAGNPAKIICSIDEYYQRNKLFNLETKNLTQQEKKKYLMDLPEDKFIKKSLMPH